MPATQGEKKDNSKEQLKRDTLNALIGEQVIHAQGAPGDLLRVQVRELWDGHYRVNVLTGADAASVRVSDSYFLVIDANGNIVNSTPKITKHY